ncbi:MAG: hypothetical protein GX230_05280 [Lentisphaerae bacterium]|jgi:hypothetical protein|nr:hypothetical protein [Lentisphaerota bacterium]
MKKLLKISCVLALAATFATTASRAADFYVASGGSHTTGTGWDTAFTNIQAALNAASPHDTIYLAGETFAVTNQLVWTNDFVTMRGGYRAADALDTPGPCDPKQWPTTITRDSSINTRLLLINAAT